MGDRLLDQATLNGWDIMDLLDAGYPHSLMALRQRNPDPLPQKSTLILSLTEEA